MIANFAIRTLISFIADFEIGNWKFEKLAEITKVRKKTKKFTKKTKNFRF